MADDTRYLNIRLTEKEIDALKKRGEINMRSMATEGAMIIRRVLAGNGEAVTVPGVNELNLLIGDPDEGSEIQDDAGQDGRAD